MVAVVMIWPAFAWLVMRFAVCTAEPKISRFSSTTGPKLQPMRMATVCSSTLSCGCVTICFCICAAAFNASSAVGKGRHDLIAHGFDHRAVILLGRGAHHVDADAHHVARAKIAQQLVELGAADHIGK